VLPSYAEPLQRGLALCCSAIFRRKDEAVSRVDFDGLVRSPTRGRNQNRSSELNGLDRRW